MYQYLYEKRLYLSDLDFNSIRNDDVEMHQFSWPLITEETELAVIKQLHTNISLYRKECIYEEFENRFSEIIGVDYPLVVNSGTTAL